MRPAASTRKSWSRHVTLRPQKLPTNTANDKTSRNGNSHSRSVESPRIRASAPAEAHLTPQARTKNPQASGPIPEKTATSSAIAREWVNAEPANPIGAIARTVRAQRNSCRHRSAKLGSVTLFSTR